MTRIRSFAHPLVDSRKLTDEDGRDLVDDRALASLESFRFIENLHCEFLSLFINGPITAMILSEYCYFVLGDARYHR